MEESESVFRRAIRSIFNAWPALRVALDHGAGGVSCQELVAWLPGAVEDWINENRDVMADEIEDCISTIINDEFNLLVEDGSLQEVAASIFQCYCLYQAGRHAEIESNFCSLRAAPSNIQVQQTSCDSDDSDSEEESHVPKRNTRPCPVEVSTTNSLQNDEVDMEQETEEVKPVEEDGWHEVKRGKKHKK